MPQSDRLVAEHVPVVPEKPRAAGATLRLDAALLSGRPAAMDRLLGQLVDLVSRDVVPAVRVCGIGEGSAAARDFVRCCESIADAFARASLEPGQVELTVSAASLAPDVAYAVRSHLLGPGRLNVLVGRRTLAEPSSCMRLWRLRKERNVRPACWPVAATGCPLLAAEKAREVAPGAALQVPLHSAWQVVELDFGSVVDPATGRPRSSLAQRVAALVRAAEDGHEAARWPTAAMRQDAWLNRRVAILLTGIGDAVEFCGMNPHEHDTLRAVQSWVDAVRRAAESTSRVLAVQKDMLPAIEACSPCRRFRRADQRADQRAEWERRWLRAVRSSAVRHRNLIAMSPWSVLPRSSADPAYVALVPVLAGTDVCSFEREVSIAHWNINKFKRFYEQLLGVLAATTAGVVVAERP